MKPNSIQELPLKMMVLLRILKRTKLLKQNKDPFLNGVTICKTPFNYDIYSEVR